MPSPLRHRDFRLFVSESFVSQLGTQVTTVAMSWHIYLLTDSVFQVGMLGLACAVPQLALTLFGGLLADAYDRRLVLGAVQVVAGLVAAALAALTLTGLASPGALFAGAVFFALGTAVETPSRQAVVPNLVGSADISAGIALNNTQQSIARVAGPSAAGIALAIIGPESCYAVDALARLAMIAALLAINRPLQGAALARPSVEAVVAGVRFVRGQPVILSFMLLDFGAALFATSNSLLPIYARDILDAGAVGLGLLHAAPVIGALAAGTVMSTVARVDRAGRCVLLGVAFYALCTIGFALSRELWLSVLLLAGTGLGNMVSAVTRHTSYQLLAPDHLRGRVTAVHGLFAQGGPQLGQFQAGLLASAGGAPFALLVGGLSALGLASVVALMPRVGEFRFSTR